MKWAAALLVVCLPLKRLEITSPFGYRLHPVTRLYTFHNGVDLRAQQDTVYAVADGRVLCAAYDDKLGIFIKLDHGSWQSSYGHLSQVFVRWDDQVYAGQPVGITGATGRVTGEHLHFSICCGNSYTDPLEFLYELLILQQHE
ncbi:MAG: mepM 1 [Mucilaginibacter sp.]|nr:mepM 1 [Mucilaginibacter sp.]